MFKIMNRDMFMITRCRTNCIMVFIVEKLDTKLNLYLDTY